MIILPIFRGRELMRRLGEREREKDVDDRDRAREKEELSEIRAQLLAEGHPDALNEFERVSFSEYGV